jgi:hypothetical protein
MASDEFPTVQFVKVLGDEAAALAQSCGVDRFPLFQFFVGSHGKVAECACPRYGYLTAAFSR